MAGVLKSASLIGWSPEAQSAFGTVLDNNDLTKFLTLQDPLLINDSPAFYTDEGMVGSGVEWLTARTVSKRFITLDIPQQPMPVDFAGLLVCGGLNTHSSGGGGSNREHKAEWAAVTTQANAKITSLAIEEESNHKYIKDVAVTGFTIRGEGSNRMEMGATLVGSQIGDLSDYTFPTYVAPRYCWNNSGTFSVGGDIKTQLLSFEVTVNAGIDMDRAWLKAASATDRLYPQAWPLNPYPARSFSWSVNIRAEAGNIATYRAAWLGASELDLDISCSGAQIGSTGDYDEVLISVPKAVITGFAQSFDSGFLTLQLSGDGNYDSTEGSPLAITVTNDISTYYVAD